MKKKNPINRKKEGSIYDKIMRENLQEIFLPLVEERLKVKIKNFRALPDKQETTIERETDAFLIVETQGGDKFILHLEFQTNDDHSMIYRMSEYHGIQLRKYRLPIKHIVIYLGEKKPTMPTQMKPKEVFEAFELVDVHQFDPNKWLSSQVPSEIILAILGHFAKKDSEIVLRAIVSKLKEVCKTTNELGKYIKQLVILSRLRKLEQLTIKISNAMPITIDIEKDYLYQLGIQQERERAKKEHTKLLAAAAKKLKEEQEKITKIFKEEQAKTAKRLKEEQAKTAKRLKREQEKALLEKKKSVAKMSKAGLNNKAIALFLNLSIKKVEAFLEEIEGDKSKK
ncbi:MAG: hypothetical protein ACPG49_09240 [Chitinophagales bacterium]